MNCSQKTPAVKAKGTVKLVRLFPETMRHKHNSILLAFSSIPPLLVYLLLLFLLSVASNLLS